jgi:hypothetical protein
MGFTFTESDVLSACLDYLHLRGILAWRTNNTGVFDPTKKTFRSFRGLKGVSDILGIVTQPMTLATGLEIQQGIILAVETKKPGNKPTADQEWFLEEVNRRGGIGVWVRSVQELEEKIAPYL